MRIRDPQLGDLATAVGAVIAIAGLAALAGGCGAAEDSGGAGAERRWSVLLLTIDTLRPDYLGANGYDRETSPYLDALFAEGVTFKSLVGYELPYSTESIVGDDCLPCKERDDENNGNNNNNNNGNDNWDEDDVLESCEELYMGSGKCEANLPSGTAYEINNNACNYMQGIRIVRQDGIIDTGSSRKSALPFHFGQGFPQIPP